jgi:hypothetical protein
VAAGARGFSGFAIGLLQLSSMTRGRPVLAQADALGTVLVERLLLASPASSDALRLFPFVFAHVQPPVTSLNPPVANTFPPFRMSRARPL